MTNEHDIDLTKLTRTTDGRILGFGAGQRVVEMVVHQKYVQCAHCFAELGPGMQFIGDNGWACCAACGVSVASPSYVEWIKQKHPEWLRVETRGS